MKNFNRCSSHGHHGWKRRELAQHAHSHGSYAFTHTLTSTQLRQLGYYFSVHAEVFRVPVIHQNLTWAARSLTCVRDYSYVRVYTRGLGTPTPSHHNILTWGGGKMTIFSCAPDGVRTLGLWILSPMLYQMLSHPVTPFFTSVITVKRNRTD